MDNNAYLVRCLATGALLLIDAAAEPEVLLSLIGDDPVAAIVTTHRHADHVGALAAVSQATGAATYAHRLDADQLPITVDHTLDDGDSMSWGACRADVLHLPGHTPGGLALVIDDPEGHPHAFTGDSLFPGGVGRTESPIDFGVLLGAVTEKLFDRLPDETWVYPGHGDDTTLGAERPSLADWRARGW
jgi:glyoxylase-like metal-dependent hydrolase (beta-lactamase superfamily II)